MPRRGMFQIRGCPSGLLPCRCVSGPMGAVALCQWCLGPDMVDRAQTDGLRRTFGQRNLLATAPSEGRGGIGTGHGDLNSRRTKRLSGGLPKS